MTGLVPKQTILGGGREGRAPHSKARGGILRVEKRFIFSVLLYLGYCTLDYLTGLIRSEAVLGLLIKEEVSDRKIY